VSQSAEDIKACCASLYQHDAVALILGDSYHPGGSDLTRRLGRALGLRPGQRVLDVASGPGASAFLMASEFGVAVDGVELGEQAVDAANAKAGSLGVGDQVRFHVGDAERLPVPDGSVDAVICECAFCTFPDKATAASEMARVVKPGGQVGITDVTLDPSRLDPELASLAGWVACIADARPLAEYEDLLSRSGLKVTLTEPHDDALTRMIEMIDARLMAFAMIKAPALEGIEIDAARQKVAIAAKAVADGVAGYKLMVARKPARVTH
jgi:SAM-dependent methyltransferase